MRAVLVCSKQKSDVTNDVTLEPPAMRCMSYIAFAAESNQVCRKEGEQKAGSKVMFFTSLPRCHSRDDPPPSQRAATALMIKMASSFFSPFLSGSQGSHSHAATRP